MLKASHPHIKPSAGSGMWDVPVPADGKTTLTCRSRSEW
jgi:hypothetical protein